MSNLLFLPLIYKVHWNYNSRNSQLRSGMVATSHGGKHMPRPAAPTKQSLDMSWRPCLLRRISHLGSRRTSTDLRQPWKLPGTQLVLPRRSYWTLFDLAPAQGFSQSALDPTYQPSSTSGIDGCDAACNFGELQLLDHYGNNLQLLHF